MHQLKKVITILTVLTAFASCSLNYGNELNSESSVPEFSFKGATLNRYSDNKISMNLQADRLEQYKSDGSSYAENASFKTYDKEGVLDTDGFCRLLASNTNDKLYTLFDGVSITVHSQNMTLNATSLHFNGKTEQLTGSVDEVVTIKRKDTSVSGKGFSASGVSRTFTFNEEVNGTVIDSQNEELNEEVTEEDDSITEGVE